MATVSIQPQQMRRYRLIPEIKGVSPEVKKAFSTQYMDRPRLCSFD